MNRIRFVYGEQQHLHCGIAEAKVVLLLPYARVVAAHDKK